MAIRVNGLGGLGESVLLLGGIQRSHIVGEAGSSRAVYRAGRASSDGRSWPAAAGIPPARAAAVRRRMVCPGAAIPTVNNAAGPSGPALVLGRLGFTPPRPEAGGVQQVRRSLPGGPHVVVGPFSFPANIAEYSFSTTYNKLLSTVDGRALMTDVIVAVGKFTSTLQAGNCYGTWRGRLAAAKNKPNCLTPIAQNKVEPRYEDRDESWFGQWRGLRIPSDALWDTRFLTGELPLFKFIHPVKNESWGVYVTISEDGNKWSFSVKRVISSDWLTKVWGWVKALVAKLVSYLDEIFDVLKGVACSIASGYLGTLSQLARHEKLPQDVSVDINAKFAEIGVGASMLDAVYQGSISAQAATALANAVKDSLCAVSSGGDGGGGGIPTVEGGGGGGVGVVIAVAAVGVPLLYFLLR